MSFENDTEEEIDTTEIEEEDWIDFIKEKHKRYHRKDGKLEDSMLEQNSPKSSLLRHRLRFFDMVVTPTVNYASGTWTLTKEHERMIQSTQRKMLRPSD